MFFFFCCQGVIYGDLHTKGEASNSCTKPDYLPFRKGERNCIFPGKKDEISPIISPLRDDLHITGDDDMAKVCALLNTSSVS